MILLKFMEDKYESVISGNHESRGGMFIIWSFDEYKRSMTMHFLDELKQLCLDTKCKNDEDEQIFKEAIEKSKDLYSKMIEFEKNKKRESIVAFY